MARGCSSRSASAVSRHRQSRSAAVALFLLVCIAGAGGGVDATNGLDGAEATFYSGEGCRAASAPLLLLPLATCLPNVTFNSSVGEVTQGRVSVWDTADYYHDKCSDPSYWVNLNAPTGSQTCGTLWPAGGDVGLSYWHCTHDNDGDGVCCGLNGSAMDYAQANMVFAHANVTYRSVSFTPRSNPRSSCRGPGGLSWWEWLLIVIIIVVFGIIGRAIIIYCRRRNEQRFVQSHHTLFDYDHDFGRN